MLNEEKIKIMNKLAMYEQGEGKKYLPVSRYYRSDYIGLAMIKNFFLVTIGYLRSSYVGSMPNHRRRSDFHQSESVVYG